MLKRSSLNVDGTVDGCRNWSLSRAYGDFASLLRTSSKLLRWGLACSSCVFLSHPVLFIRAVRRRPTDGRIVYVPQFDVGLCDVLRSVKHSFLHVFIQKKLQYRRHLGNPAFLLSLV